ncbi:putative alpha-l-rhamnosidase c protein [Daldinia childiae]|uniref:putative alpha-l-rhamnosidase c protein n=1 Tax=Daldinia childiae TaxID=326645 RepID=UPI001445B3E6|nr:putative alpha-l-rhamnosidase c protein [Daldinia childiae]KAF3059225.1 putative alpha-l-rhamnosidase c protein [Daldinia childiae]
MPLDSPRISKEGQEDTVDRATTISTATDQNDSLSQRAPIMSTQAQEGVGSALASNVAAVSVQMQEYSNGYHFPPKYPIKEQIRMGLVSFWEFYNTGFGFFLTIYSLNVVAWGGMLFLLLCNAAPETCWVDGKFDCDNIDSPRRIWIETDSQILNGLFCVTGFGLAPWRFRDLYFLLRYRIQGDQKALRSLAGVHRGWFRLPGSEQLPTSLGPKNIEEMIGNYNVDSVPYPLETISDAPPTSIRAPPTKMWKLDFIIYFNVANTFLQCVLSGFMWALNRYDRPSWSTGLFVCLACIASAIAGIMMGVEGKHVKAIEGVPLTKRDIERLARDKELGIPHYNNLGDKNPEDEKEKKKMKKQKQRFGKAEQSSLATDNERQAFCV